MVEILAYVGGTSKNPYFASASSNPIAQAAANGTLQPGAATNYGPAVVISYGGSDATLAPSSYSALGAGGGVITADQAYIQANSDVAAGIASGRFRTGLEHYLLYGASEGRFYAGVGAQTLTPEQLYLEENPDVASGIQSGYFRNGLEHYLVKGAAEGRYYFGQSQQGLSAEQLYLQENPDVAANLGHGFYNSGLEHFYKYGQAEGRFYYGLSYGAPQYVSVPTVQATHNGTVVSLSPDQQYLLSNPAAAQAVASGRYRDGLQYFINEGYASGGSYRNLQGWRLNSPAERSYLQVNPDVAEAAASGLVASGEDHFFTYGKNESFRSGYGQLTNAAYNAATVDGSYLRANRDAAVAIANGQYATGLDYFLAVGAGKGQSYGTISAASLAVPGERQYLTANRDVAASVATGTFFTTGLAHFLATGYAEGRSYGNLTGTSLASGPSAALDLAYLKAHPEAAGPLAAGQFSSVFAYFATLGVDRGDTYGRLAASTLGDSNERNYLIRNKDVAVAVATGAQASGLQHYLTTGYAEGRGDYGGIKAASLTDPALGSLELAYLQQNPDVARAVAGGQFSSGLAHFLTVGGAEGRHYGALQVGQALGSSAEAVYIVTHADAAAAIATGQVASGLEYFLKTGIDKGQSYGKLSAATLGAANDPERQYLTRFQDVAKAVAEGVQPSGLAHYLSYGYKDRLGINYGALTAEMLNPNFLEGQYLQSHSAAADAVARGQAKNGIDYFLKTGVDRGDSYGKLSAGSLAAAGPAERAYLAQNLDVARNVAGPNGFFSGLVHYLTSGYAEGRPSGYGALNGQTYKPGTAEFKYLLANQDAALAVANGAAASGLDYFIAIGAGKGQSYGALTAATLAAGGAAEQDYLLKNRDVANAVGLGAYTNGLDHFLKVGRTEGRNYGQLRPETLQGTAANNPELAYLLANRDVAAAVAAGTYASGLMHYFTYGRSEGRTGYGGVSSEVMNATGLEGDYLRANPLALQAVASGQVKSGLEYFLKTGAAKGESYGRLNAAAMAAVGPGEQEFLSRNLDVAKAVAEGSQENGFEFYINGGYTQAWRGLYGGLRSDFYAKNDAQGAYLRANKDAAKAVADGTAASGIDYFLRVGADKGQSYGTLTAEKLGAVGGPERAYLTQYQDVAAAVAAGSFTSGLQHYLTSGYADSRRSAGYGRLNGQTYVAGTLEWKYLKGNLEAAAAVASGASATGLAYFFETGIKKGQSYGLLNNATVGKEGAEYEYLKAHADVAQQVASGAVKSGLVYFLSTGADQGQSYGKIAAGKLGTKTDPERKYLTRYLDVAAAVAAGAFGSGLVHYLSAGKADGRVYEGSAGAGLQTVTLDPTARDSWYLVSNEAAYLAVAKGEAKSGLEYFLKVGIDNGDTYGLLNRERFGDASSLERQYLSRNLDVAAAVAEGVYVNGLAHYLDIGRTEAGRGRFGKLDPSKLGGSALGDAERKYLQANLDVGQAIADGRYQGDGLQHYLTWGYKESNRGSYGGLKDDVEFKTTNAENEATYLLARRNLAEAIAAGQISDTGLTYFIKNEIKSGAYGKFNKNRHVDDPNEAIYLTENSNVAREVALGNISSGFQSFVEVSVANPSARYGSNIVDDLLGQIQYFLDVTNTPIIRDILQNVYNAGKEAIAIYGLETVNSMGEKAASVYKDLMSIPEYRELWDAATKVNGGIPVGLMFGDTVTLPGTAVPHTANVSYNPTVVHIREDLYGNIARQYAAFETYNAFAAQVFAEISQDAPNMTREQYIDAFEKREYHHLESVLSLYENNPSIFGPFQDTVFSGYIDPSTGKMMSWSDYRELTMSSVEGRNHREHYGRHFDNITELRETVNAVPGFFTEMNYSQQYNYIKGHTFDFSSVSVEKAALEASLIGGRNLSAAAKAQLNAMGITTWSDFGEWRGDDPASSYNKDGSYNSENYYG